MFGEIWPICEPIQAFAFHTVKDILSMRNQPVDAMIPKHYTFEQ